MTDDGRDCDMLLPYILLAVSTGLTPFELLFGHQPHGLLYNAKEAWEEQPASFRSVVEYVRDMQNKLMLCKTSTNIWRSYATRTWM